MIYSNSPLTQSGYGKQTKLLLDQMHKAGLRTAVAANFGADTGFSKYTTRWGDTVIYPRDFSKWGAAALDKNYRHFREQSSNPGMLITLFDVWPLAEYKALDQIQIHAWTPCDHAYIIPAVKNFLDKENIHPIAMAPDGHEQMKSAQIKSTYIPHAVDTSVYFPGAEADGKTGKDYMGIDSDRFVFGTVAANKANGQVHRKALAEIIMAFGQHVQKHPKSLLYLHTYIQRDMGGFEINRLLQVNGIKPENVLMPDPFRLSHGFSDKEMAAIFNAMDCYLGPSYGEGFQVPLIEAQACGIPGIASRFTAPKDLVSEDWIQVEGQLFWDEAQGSYWQIPSVGQIMNAMDQMVERKTDAEIKSQKSLDFSKQFDVEVVWKKKWKPYIKANLALD